MLDRLVRAERLSEEFRERLLSWEYSCFSVHAGEAIESTARESLERMARYMTRTSVALAKVFEQRDGRVKLLTPPDPKMGEEFRLFDPLDWVHAVTTQIKNRGMKRPRASRQSAPFARPPPPQSRLA